MIQVGDVLDGKYEILREIGKGGMSIVYLAVDTRLNKQWAVKEYRKAETAGAVGVNLVALQKEAEVIKKLDHPVLPRIVDIIYTGDTACIVMDYIEGKTLGEVLEKEGAVPQNTVVSWAKSLCGALSYMHGMNPPVIYRDMKPSNIMLKPDGTIKLIDFGTALEGFYKEDETIYALGTRGYAAPEQIDNTLGDKSIIDARTDIYSLGVTICTLLTGRLPESIDKAKKLMESDTVHISGGIRHIVLKCMAEYPKDRYQSCEELLFHLNNYNKYDKAYILGCRKNLCRFAAMIVLTMCFLAISVSGYAGINVHKNSEYEELIALGDTYVIDGDYEAAAESYTAAAVDVDGSRPEAYTQLLKLYEDYLDMPEEGLMKVGHYIDQNYEGINENAELIIQVGMDYFEIVKDYQKSAYYFGLVNSEVYPEAKMYKTIALSMYRLDAGRDELDQVLIKLLEYTEQLPSAYNKLRNYELICDVYSKNMQEIEGAAAKLVEVAEKGILQLDRYEDESVKADYYIAFNQYIITGCECLGEGSYEKALESCDAVLGIVSKNDNAFMGTVKAEKYRLSKLCKKAELLAKLFRYEEAREVYENAEREYGDDAMEIYIGHLGLLCDIEEQRTTDVEEWESSEIIDVYEKGSKISGIEDDYRWKRLKVRLQPILEEEGSRQY